MGEQNHWIVGYNSDKQIYVPVPVPGLGTLDYDSAKAECDRLNKIKDDIKERRQNK